MRSGSSRQRSNSAPEPSLTEADDAMRAHLEAAVADTSASFADEQLFGDFTYDDCEVTSGSFTAVNDASASGTTLPNTVSPNDLSYTHDDFSVPNSNSFTNLTTPSLLDDESPYLNDSLDVSPAFGSGDFSGTYPPLFPTDDFSPDHYGSLTPAPRKRKNADAHASRSTDAQDMSRTPSGRSDLDNQTSRHELLRHRLSQTAGITKSTRRATRDLPPIQVDETADEIAAKRAKNTMAARKSRQKKKDEVDQLEAKLIDMMDERDYWKMLAIKHGAPIPDSPTPSAMSPST